MKKISILIILLFGIYIQNFAQNQEIKYQVSIPYMKMKEIEKIMGTNKSIAFYALKDVETLSYSIYNTSTSKVVYFDGKIIKDTEYRNIKANMSLDKNIIFSTKNIGATGIGKYKKGIFNFIFRQPLGVLDYKINNVRLYENPEIYDVVFYIQKKVTSPYNHFIAYKIINRETNIELEGGGGPGEGVVGKLP
jgi:hypothetical protein